ncbi:MAG: DUF1552 domain-containing protein [Myxococcales bacterium]|nr:DUF1552 domain-containing protein [Myxococcales bacterium]
MSERKPPSFVRHSRRFFLAGAAGFALGLPFLEALAPKKQALAAPGDKPKRLIVVVHRQGTVLSQWTPSGSETSFTLPSLLAPLAPYQSKLLVVSGVDNKAAAACPSGDGHQRAGATLLTADSYDSNMETRGPSIDQLVASRLQGNLPYRSINVAVGHGGGLSGGALKSGFFFVGAKDPVSSIADPAVVFSSLFAGKVGQVDPSIAQQRVRDIAVLDAVADNFKAFRARLGKDDQLRLDNHAAKIEAIQKRVVAAGSTQAKSCVAPALNLPSGYNTRDEGFIAPLQMDLVASALACNLARVATVVFDQGHAPEFAWLNSGSSIVPSKYDNWHMMVHDGRSPSPEPALVQGYRWYSESVATLLGALQSYADPEEANKTLLDTSLVLWISNFGDGNGHNTLKLPIVIAGTTGSPSGMGRYLDLSNKKAWTDSQYSTSQVFTSLLHAFGGNDAGFGNTSVGGSGAVPGIA